MIKPKVSEPFFVDRFLRDPCDQCGAASRQQRTVRSPNRLLFVCANNPACVDGARVELALVGDKP